jgi:hypothetical protein
MLSVVILGVIFLCFIILSVNRPNVVLLHVVAPFFESGDNIVRSFYLLH